MTKFFDVLNELTEGVTIQDLNALFSNFYLDELFKPQWERFGVTLKTKPDPNIHEIELKAPSDSCCCSIS